jgi:hypothetical protein
MSAPAAILPLPTEQDSWSDMAFSTGVTGSFNAGSKTLTIGGTPSSDLEIGPQFGPSNPGRHYGTSGTLGNPFSATLSVSGVIVESNGTVSNGGSLSIVLDGSAPGSIGDDYVIANGTPLLTGSVLEVLLDATGADTLDVLFSISGGALQNDNPDPNVGVFAPNSLGLLRIGGVATPAAWTSNFSLNGATINVLGIPEPSTMVLGLFGAAIGSIARRRTQGGKRRALRVGKTGRIWSGELF